MEHGRLLAIGFLVTPLVTTCCPALAQPVTTTPATQHDSSTQQIVAPAISLEELEKLVGGRTTLTLKVQDATLEQVAAAMSQSTGLEFVARLSRTSQMMQAGRQMTPPLLPPDQPDAAPRPFTPPPPPRFTVEATGQPFWETLFAWRDAARQADAAAVKDGAAAPQATLSDGRIIHHTLRRTPTIGVERLQSQKSFSLSSNPLPSGRLISAWPLVMLATNIQRSQQGQFDADPLLVHASRTSLSPISTAQTVQKTGGDGEQNGEEKAETMVWNDQLRLSLTTFFDPKLKPQNIHCEVEEAVDELGNDLRISSRSDIMRMASLSSYIGSSSGLPVSISLASRPALGKQIKKLRGVIIFNVPIRFEKWEINDVTTPIQRNISRDGVLYQLQFTGLENTGAGWKGTFLLTAQREKLLPPNARGGGYYWRSASSAQNDFGVEGATLTDNQGHTLVASRTTTQHVSEAQSKPGVATVSPPVAGRDRWAMREEQTVTFSPTTNPDSGLTSPVGTSSNGTQTNVQRRTPVKITLNIPVENREVRVPFEFTNLPLPPS
jgi:hypothetical protein